MSLMRGARFGTVTVLLMAAPAFAHDFWIEPSSFRPEGDHITRISLGIGHNLRGTPIVRDRSQIEQFVVVGPNGAFPVFGQDARHPAGLIRTPVAGIYIVGYHSRPVAIQVEAERFEAYLKEEGLAHIIALRAERGETQRPGRERFSRCAKTIIASGDLSASGFDKRLGFPLELLPLSNPMIASGEAVPFLVLYDQNPCAGVQVTAVRRDRPDEPLVARSDQHGRVSLDLDGGGVWLIKTVHVVRAPAGSGADWESFWASLTFERNGSDAAERATSRPVVPLSTSRPAGALTGQAHQPPPHTAPAPTARGDSLERFLHLRHRHRSGPATRPAR